MLTRCGLAALTLLLVAARGAGQPSGDAPTPPTEQIAHRIAGATPDVAWVRIGSRGFLFSALLPGQPEIERQQTSSFVGNTRSTMIESRLQDSRMAVVVTELPRAATWLAPRWLLFDQARRRLVEENGFHDLRSSSTTRSNLDGRLLDFSAAPAGEPARRGRAELYIVRGHLILAMASRAIDSSSALVDRFFANLALDPNHCRGAPATGRCEVDLVLTK